MTFWYKQNMSCFLFIMCRQNYHITFICLTYPGNCYLYTNWGYTEFHYNTKCNSLEEVNVTLPTANFKCVCIWISYNERVTTLIRHVNQLFCFNLTQTESQLINCIQSGPHKYYKQYMIICVYKACGNKFFNKVTLVE